MKRTIMREIIIEQSKKYKTANNNEKSLILDHVVAITGINRKSAIRSINRYIDLPLHMSTVKLGRPRLYSQESKNALHYVWESLDYPVAERLYPLISESVRIFKRDGMWRFSDKDTDLLIQMSLATTKRLCVAAAKKLCLVRGIGTTQSGPVMKSVPIFHGSWAGKPAGHGQADTVVHSGSKLMGNMVYTVNFVDVATYWKEFCAQLQKGAEATYASMERIRLQLPFPMLGIHPDSGREFINELIIKWAKLRGIELTRSRPHKSNDNCYIEQSNLVVVRKYVGYERYDCQEAVDAMNRLYDVLRLYLNFFQSNYKLQSKQARTNTDGKVMAKPYKRIYDTPKTPYQRVLEREDITEENKSKLIVQYESLNPIVLRDKIRLLTTKLEKVQREQGYTF
jgi:hypothetical protein